MLLLLLLLLLLHSFFTCYAMIPRLKDLKGFNGNTTYTCINENTRQKQQETW